MTSMHPSAFDLIPRQMRCVTHSMHECAGGLSGGASLQEPVGSEDVPEELSVEELERHIRALQLEIARSDATRAGNKVRRGNRAEQTGGDDPSMHATTPATVAGSGSRADEDLHLMASYSMRWTVSPERRQE